MFEEMMFGGLLGRGLLFICLFVLLMVWSAVWKAIALWKSGRNNQPVWFVVLFIINTAGILEIIYLLAFQKKEKPARRRR